MNKDTIIIVASGPSLAQVDPSRFDGLDPFIIAVNGAYDWLPSLNAFFTLDPSSDNIRRMKNRRDGVEYYAALGERRSNIPSHVHILERLSSPVRDTRPRGTATYWFNRWGCLRGLSDDSMAIHSGNSAYGALGLAYHWKPKKILLLGVDGNQQPKMNGEGPPRHSLMHLPLLFQFAKPQLDNAGIEVINGSKQSAIDCFPRVKPEEGLEWILQ